MIRKLLFLVALGLTWPIQAQTVEDFFDVPLSKLKTHLLSLPELCESEGQWINAVGPDPLGHAHGIALMHFGSFEDPVSVDAMRKLSQLQNRHPSLRVYLSLFPAYPYARNPQTVAKQLGQNQINLPVLLDTAGTFWNCTDVTRPGMTIYVSPNSRIVAREYGPLSLPKLSAVSARLHDLFQNHIPEGVEPFYGVSPDRGRALPVIRRPMGLATNPVEKTLYVSDMSNDRILGITSEGRVVYCFGSEQAGFADGRIHNARFNGPNGLAFDRTTGILYVADTYNHRVRAIDPARDSVYTVLGNGSPPRLSTKTVNGTQGSIGFPTSLLLDHDRLYIGSASPPGSVWEMDTRSHHARVRTVGGARDSLAPLPLLALGLASGRGGEIYFTDALGNTVDRLSQGTSDIVAGKKGAFGFANGKKDDLLFRYPTGLCSHDGYVYVADSYNHVIRRVNPAKPKCKTVVGDGRSGFADGPANKARLQAPTDVAYMNGLMYIADAGNGAIRVYDPSKKNVHTLELRGYGCIGHDKTEVIMDLRDGPAITVNEGLTVLHFKLDMDDRFEIDKEGFSQVTPITQRQGFALQNSDLSTGYFTAASQYRPEDRGAVSFDLRLFLREKSTGRVFYRALTLYMKVRVDKDAPGESDIVLPVKVKL